jgi:hypothetical protein
MSLETGQMLVPFGINHFCETIKLEREQNKNPVFYSEFYS